MSEDSDIFEGMPESDDEKLFSPPDEADAGALQTWLPRALGAGVHVKQEAKRGILNGSKFSHDRCMPIL